MKSQHVQLLYGNGEAIRPIKDTYPHIASTPREVGVSHDPEFGSFVGLLGPRGAPPPQWEERSVKGMARRCSCPASKRSWQGAPKTRSTPCLRQPIPRSP